MGLLCTQGGKSRVFLFSFTRQSTTAVTAQVTQSFLLTVTSVHKVRHIIPLL